MGIFNHKTSMKRKIIRFCRESSIYNLYQEMWVNDRLLKKELDVLREVLENFFFKILEEDCTVMGFFIKEHTIVENKAAKYCLGIMITERESVSLKIYYNLKKELVSIEGLNIEKSEFKAIKEKLLPHLQ